MKHLTTGSIPVFVFHEVKAEDFAIQMEYLAENKYTPLSAEELYATLTGKTKRIDKPIVLTFDDGLRSLWKTAYPLLKKHGFPAIAFISPNLIPEDHVSDFRGGKYHLCSWPELQEMSSTGTVDIQSHTCFHHSVFTGDNPVDFVNPDTLTSFLNNDLHMLSRRNAGDVLLDNPEWGTPIFDWAPAMSASTRFIEDDNLRLKCVAYVAQNGGRSFFTRKGWRKELLRFYQGLKKKYGDRGYFQSPEERYSEIRQDLLTSKKIIEKKLHNHVSHLCYPWFKGSPLAVEASREVGYKANYWGILPGRSLNYVGSDPFRIARISGRYIQALPGRGRRSFLKLLKGDYM